MTVPDLMGNEKMQAAILREATVTVEKNGAEVIYFVCTGIAKWAKLAQEELDVPVLDPVLIGLKTVEFRACSKNLKKG